MKSLKLIPCLALLLSCGENSPTLPSASELSKTEPTQQATLYEVDVTLSATGATLRVPDPYVIRFYDIATWTPENLTLTYTSTPGYSFFENPDCTFCDGEDPRLVHIAIGTLQLTVPPKAFLEWEWTANGHGLITLFPSYEFPHMLCLGNIPNHLLVQNTETGRDEFWNICGDRMTNDNVNHPGEVVWNWNEVTIPAPLPPPTPHPNYPSCRKPPCEVSE